MLLTCRVHTVTSAMSCTTHGARTLPARRPATESHVRLRRDTCQTCPSLVRFRTRPNPVCSESWRAPWSRATGLPHPSYPRPLILTRRLSPLRPPDYLTLSPWVTQLVRPTTPVLFYNPSALSLSLSTPSPFSSLLILTTRALMTPPRTRVLAPTSSLV